MGTGGVQGETCEKCGKDEGYRELDTWTQEWFFGCANCGWGWSYSYRRFGRSLLRVLRKLVETKPSWIHIDVVLRALAEKCEENGHAENNWPLAQITALLQTPANLRDAGDRAFVAKLADFNGLRALRNGESIMDYREGYKGRDGTEWAISGSADFFARGRQRVELSKDGGRDEDEQESDGDTERNGWDDDDEWNDSDDDTEWNDSDDEEWDLSDLLE